MAMNNIPNIPDTGLNSIFDVFSNFNYTPPANASIPVAAMPNV